MQSSCDYQSRRALEESVVKAAPWVLASLICAGCNRLLYPGRKGLSRESVMSRIMDSSEQLTRQLEGLSCLQQGRAKQRKKIGLQRS